MTAAAKKWHLSPLLRSHGEHSLQYGISTVMQISEKAMIQRQLLRFYLLFLPVSENMQAEAVRLHTNAAYQRTTPDLRTGACAAAEAAGRNAAQPATPRLQYVASYCMK